MTYKKRKREQRDEPAPVLPDLTLHVQAHEADVVCGLQAEQASAYLEVQKRDANTSLIRWAASGSQTAWKETSLHIHDEGDDMPDPETGEEDVWVDRYDARLLLDSVPTFDHEPPDLPSGGWSNLPEDAEDLFYFAPDEIEEYRREKRRRTIEQDREERVKARRAEDGEEEDEDPWGGSDEEPDDVQSQLMHKTAKHVASSPNPAQLEMRILANFGGDKKFAFLRGRWSRAWANARRLARQEQDQAENPTPVTLGGLGDYGDSDDDSDQEPSPPEPIPPAKPAVNETGSEEIKAARRAKLKEWAEQRRREKQATS
ncbi:hypothetical protein BD626DRAFT_396886 [Schizophyllum amplum]|uniref:Uncharacterized protein n=1 Tax=Schizophyllum amplum TaxID=97359 RepID=A0A550CPK8_9AGAR|nr:hypothetical protein BD626DRAFT_396886 [Auriculariopsis ampla]